MKLTLSTVGGDVFILDVSADIELENLKALAGFEIGLPATEIAIMHEMRLLTDNKESVTKLGVKDGDILLVQRIAGSAQANQPMDTTAPEENPALMRDVLLANPGQLALLRESDPELAAALRESDEAFSRVFNERRKALADKEMERRRMMNDPLNPETQRLIAEQIQQQNINSNMEAAMEHHPEAFASVVMLYIKCKVNGNPVTAFVDSGAQRTIMSAQCAERCGLTRLIDRRWAGVAKGVGTQKIIGRIHLVQLEIEKDFLVSSVCVLEEQPMDLLLGLDMLKRFQCCIDLRKNMLVIGTTGKETPFLPESELPASFRLEVPENQNEEEAFNKAVADSIKSSPNAGPSTSTSSSQKKTLKYGTEAQLEEIMALGFKRDEAIKELEEAQGDKNKALAVLFARSFTMPK